MAMGFAKRSTHPTICCPTGKSPGQFIAPRVQPLLQKYSDFPKTLFENSSLAAAKLVIRGLDPRIHRFSKKMDCRIKSGNDG